MKSHARLHKTLASLAFAMTATALGLHWMDPSLQAAATQLSSQQLEPLARELVLESVSLRTNLWQNVEITTDDEPLGSRLALTASRSRTECHFYIDAAGRPSRDAQWSRQSGWQDAPHTIRIHLERADSEAELATQGQWMTVQTLIRTLDAALEAHGTMPIHIRSDLVDPDTALYSSNL